MKKTVFLLFAVSLLMVGCGKSEKVKYEPYGKSTKISKTTTTKIEKGFDVPFTTEGGVRYVMITMNGVSGVKALFDTGCSGMSMSELELANLVKQGTIMESDIGIQYVTIADGTTMTIPTIKMSVNLTDTKGEEHSATVETGVQPNPIADVLVGNAVFSQMGSKIVIDDEKQIIHFE